MSTNKFSRRNFVKTGIFSSVAVAGAGSLAACSSNPELKRKALFPLFMGDNYKPADGVAGILFSQVGYESGLPVKVIIRLPNKNTMPETVTCILDSQYGEPEFRTK